MSKAGTSSRARLFSHDPFKKLTIATIFIFTYGMLITAPAAATLLVLQAGMEAPLFSLQTTEGAVKKAPDLQGEKLTVLVFWSSWIRKSEAVLSRMEKLYEELKSKGLSVVGINVDEQKPTRQGAATVKNTAQKLKIQYPMLIDPGLTTFRDFGVIALPTTVVLDKDRVIKHELSGYPLVGAEEMADFITASITGATPKTASKPHYQPSKSAVSFYSMGLASLRSKVLAEKAEPWFKKSVQADPGFLLPHLSLGRIYSERGEVGQASAEYQAVLAKEPQHPVALCELAILLIDQGKQKEGLEMLDAARKAEDSYAPCYYYTGYALGSAGNDAEAGKMFDEAQKLNPHDYRGLAYQGKLAEQKKDLKGAAEYYSHALEKIVHAN